jgi:hypothetical protein
MRQKNTTTDPAEPETKNDYAGKDYHQITRQDWGPGAVLSVKWCEWSPSMNLKQLGKVRPWSVLTL